MNEPKKPIPPLAKKVGAVALLVGAISWLPPALTVLIFLVTAGMWLQHKFRSVLFNSQWQVMAVSFVALASTLSLSGRYMVYRHYASKQEAAAIVAEQKAAENAARVASEKFTRARAAILNGDFKNGAVLSEEAASIASPIQGKAKALSRSANLLTSEAAVKEKLLSLSPEEYRKLESGNGPKLSDDSEVEPILSKHMAQKAKSFKAVYASVKAEQEKTRKEAERKQKQTERRIANFGEAPTQSAWDGSYSPVKRFLKESAHDPDSIEMDGCTAASVDDKAGWIVGCNYRGKNAFGAKIKNSNWFVIRHGAVVKMLPPGAYK